MYKKSCWLYFKELWIANRHIPTEKKILSYKPWTWKRCLYSCYFYCCFMFMVLHLWWWVLKMFLFWTFITKLADFEFEEVTFNAKSLKLLEETNLRTLLFFFVLTWSIWSGISDLWEKHKPEAVMQLWSFTNTIPLVSDEKHKSYTWLAFTTSNLLLSSSLKDNILDTISKKQCFVWTSVFFCIFMNLNDVMPQGWNTETFWKQKYTTGGDVRQGLDWLILLVFYSISKNFSGQSWGHQ